MTNQQVNLSKAQNGASGTYHQNGFKVTPQPTAKNDNYKNYCFKCGKPNSAHKLFQGCPK
jgi:hypothetical protein